MRFTLNVSTHENPIFKATIRSTYGGSMVDGALLGGMCAGILYVRLVTNMQVDYRYACDSQDLGRLAKPNFQPAECLMLV